MNKMNIVIINAAVFLLLDLSHAQDNVPVNGDTEGSYIKHNVTKRSPWILLRDMPTIRNPSVIETEFPFKLSNLTDSMQRSAKGIYNSEIKITNSQIYLLNHTKPMINIAEEVPRCEGQSFCENVPNYPEELANEIIRNNPQLLEYASEEHTVVPLSTVPKSPYPVVPRTYLGVPEGRVFKTSKFPETSYPEFSVHEAEIPDSVDFSPSTEEMCASNARTVFLHSGETMSGKWKYILNGKGFKQAVTIETCVNKGMPCEVIDNNLANGYVTFCEQKEVYYQMYGIESDDTPKKDYFRIPVSCCCRVKFNGFSNSNIP